MHALNGQRTGLSRSDDECAGPDVVRSRSSAALHLTAPQGSHGQTSPGGHDGEQRPGHDVGAHRQPAIEGQGEQQIPAHRADDGRVEDPQRLGHRGVAPQAVVHLEGGEDPDVDNCENADGQQATGRSRGRRPLRGPPRSAVQGQIGGQDVDDHQGDGLDPAHGQVHPRRSTSGLLHGPGSDRRRDAREGQCLLSLGCAWRQQLRVRLPVPGALVGTACRTGGVLTRFSHGSSHSTVPADG